MNTTTLLASASEQAVAPFAGLPVLKPMRTVEVGPQLFEDAVVVPGASDGEAVAFYTYTEQQVNVVGLGVFYWPELSVLLLTVLALLAVRKMWKVLREKRKVGTPYCRKCGYDLTGNTTKQCPECGGPAEGKGVRKGTLLRRRLVAPAVVLVVVIGAVVGLNVWNAKLSYRFQTTLRYETLIRRFAQGELFFNSLPRGFEIVDMSWLDSGHIFRLLDEHVVEPPWDATFEHNLLMWVELDSGDIGVVDCGRRAEAIDPWDTIVLSSWGIVFDPTLFSLRDQLFLDTGAVLYVVDPATRMVKPIGDLDHEQVARGFVEPNMNVVYQTFVPSADLKELLLLDPDSHFIRRWCVETGDELSQLSLPSSLELAGTVRVDPDSGALVMYRSGGVIMIDTQREQVSSVAEDVNSDDFVDHVLYNELFFAMPWVSISGKVWMDYDSGTPAGMYYFCNPDKDEFYAVIHLLSATDISHVQATDDETRLYIVYDRLIPTSQIGETPNGRVLAEYDISMLKLSETEAQADHELHEE